MSKHLVCKRMLLKAYRAGIPLSSLVVGSRWLNAHEPQPQPWTNDEAVFSDEEINSSDGMNIWHMHRQSLRGILTVINSAI